MIDLWHNDLNHIHCEEEGGYGLWLWHEKFESPAPHLALSQENGDVEYLVFHNWEVAR